MGLESTCECNIDGLTVPVRALLESKELTLRGGARKTIPIDQISNASVFENSLTFTADGQSFGLRLGAEQAAKWLKKIMTPPPSLAAKLGIKPGVKVFLVNGKASAELLTATAGYATTSIADADVICAVVTDLDQLQRAMNLVGSWRSAPLWTIYPKGKASSLSEGLVRQTMRAAGYMDTKVSAVSDQFSATRYNFPKI